MIHVGVSGWSYEEWVGPFYPVSLRGRSERWLAHYATRFRSVEINSTFYAMPSEDLVAAWCRAGAELQARGPFEFSLKLPREATHDALAAGDVQRAWEVAARFERQVLDPLSDEGLLGAVLVQLSPAFSPDAGRVAALREMLAALAGRKVAVEPRHPGWARDGRLAPEALPLFDSPDVCLAEVDGPAFPALETPPARHAYLRLHGRRHDRWHARGGGQDGARYDYLYAEEELAPWAARAQAHEDADREVRVFFNNTPGAKATVNAVDMLRLLGRGGDVPRPKLTAQTTLEL